MYPAKQVPFIHFFDGFRTSHEISKIAPWPDDTIRALLPGKIAEHRQRARWNTVIADLGAFDMTLVEARNPWYDGCDHVESDGRFSLPPPAVSTNRLSLRHPQAERVIDVMGSAIGTCEEGGRPGC